MQRCSELAFSRTSVSCPLWEIPGPRRHTGCIFHPSNEPVCLDVDSSHERIYFRTVRHHTGRSLRQGGTSPEPYSAHIRCETRLVWG